MSPETTDIQEFEQEILVQGHPGTIYGLTSSLEDQFVSSGKQTIHYVIDNCLEVINAIIQSILKT